MDWLLSNRDPARQPRQGPAETDIRHRDRLEGMAREQEARVISRLRHEDPGLDLDAAIAAGRRAFSIAKRAENLGRADMARQVMTEAGWQEFQAAEANYELQGERFITSDIIVGTVRVVDGSTRAGAGELVLDVWSTGFDQRIHLPDGSSVPGSTQLREWVERICLRRDSGPGSPVPICANCGSPLRLGPDGHCRFCQALPPGVSTDWLIDHREAFANDAALAQEASSVVVGSAPEAVAALPPIQPGPGVAAALAEITGRDPQFGARSLVIQARSGLLLVERAYAEVNPGCCRAVVADACWQRIADEIDTLRVAGERRVHGFLDIDDAGIIAVVVAPAEDQVTVRIHLRSTRCRLKLGADIVTQGDDRKVVPWAVDVVMQRSGRARTPAAAGFVGGTCPVCARALVVDDAGNCVGCGRHLTGGDVDWVVTALSDVRS